MSKTIQQVFESKGLWTWFSSPVTNFYDGQSEKGQDYSTTFGTPVGVPVGGRIVRIVHNNNAINDVVELQDSSGAVWLYQHIDAKVRVGQSLGCGGVIGTENGLPVDQYSTGPHIEVRYCPSGWSITTDSWNEPWINPREIFSGLAGQTAGSIATGGLTDFVSGIPIAPNAEIAGLLAAFDAGLKLQNPFEVTPAQDTINAGPVSFSISDPVDYASKVLSNMYYDAMALAVRLIFLVLGGFILLKVSSAFIDYGAIAGAAEGAVKTAAGIGMALA